MFFVIGDKMNKIENNIKILNKNKQKVYISPKKLLAFSNHSFESCTITKTEVIEGGKVLCHGNNQTKNPKLITQGTNLLLSTQNILNKNTEHIVEMLNIEYIRDLRLTKHIINGNGKHTFKIAFRYGNVDYNVQLCA